MTFRSGIAAAALCVAAVGCGEDRQPVTVSVQAPNREGQVVPIGGAELTLLPFDIDSLYRELEQRNQAGSEPATDSLEVLYQEFYAADTALIAADTALLRAQRRLEEIEDRASPEYRQAFNAFEAAQGRYDSLTVARDSAEAVYAPARAAYNTARQQWEGSAWDGFAEANENLYAETPPPTDSAGADISFQQRTGEDGTFRVWLAPGDWWVAGRVPVPGAARQVYRFNEGFTVGEEPVTVELTGDDATVLNTY